jgi:lysyl endopeptidase
MRQFYITLLFIFLIAGGVVAQVQTRFLEDLSLDESGIFGVPSLGTVQDLPKNDVAKLVEEDELQESMAVPFRFGYAMDVNYSVSNSGKWYDKPEGRVWKLNLRSEGAFSINLIFEQLVLPSGGELYIYNGERTMLYGPLNAEITNKSQTFSTDLIQGDFITLELFEPEYAHNTTKLKINKVIHGYKNMFETSSSSNYGNARSCHNNVNCNGFSNWQSRSNSVAMVLLADGTRACSGSLLNNTCQDFTPNFLTAFHCIDIGNNIDECEIEYGNGQLNQNEINRAQNWVFRFQYKSPTCDPTSAPNSWVSYNGSTYRAGWAQTDFALVEMNTRPTAETGIQYAGWSRSNVPPASGATIHHPRGDPMKISTYNDPATHSTQLTWQIGCNRVNQTPANSHWSVTLTNGTAEPISSGAPLFDQERRVIG